MKVSIIVPVYNTEAYLSKCIDSILNQTYSNIELILINDGSTDNSESIIKKYSSANSNIKYITQKNSGQSKARNKGLEVATGDYIVFADSDDFLESNMIEELIKPFSEDNDIEITICNYYIYYSKNNKIKNVLFQNNIPDLKRAYLIEAPGPCFKIFKKNLLKDFAFPEDIIYEDLACIPYLIAKAKKIYYVPKYLYYYRQHSNSIVNSYGYSPNKLDVLKASEILLNKFQDKTVNEYLPEVEFVLIKHLFYVAGLRFFRYPKPVSKLKLISDFKDKYLENYQDNSYYKSLITKSDKKLITKILNHNVLYCYYYLIKQKIRRKI